MHTQGLNRSLEQHYGIATLRGRRQCGCYDMVKEQARDGILGHRHAISCDADTSDSEALSGTREVGK